MTKKLFAVEITHRAYAYVEDEHEAADLASEICDTEDYPDVFATEVTSNIFGWDPACCIYHNEEGDIRLSEVLPTPSLS